MNFHGFPIQIENWNFMFTFFRRFPKSVPWVLRTTKKEIHLNVSFQSLYKIDTKVTHTIVRNIFVNSSNIVGMFKLIHLQRFLPLDLSQPVYGGLYPTVSNHPGTTVGFNQFVRSSFFCKELQEAYTSSTVSAESKQELLSDSIQKSGNSKTSKSDYGPLSDSDSCSNSSAGFQHGRSSSPQGKTSTKTEKKKKELVRDDAYYERRRKNNDAAKRSRDSRRKKVGFRYA